MGVFGRVVVSICLFCTILLSTDGFGNTECVHHDRCCRQLLHGIQDAGRRIVYECSTKCRCAAVTDVDVWKNGTGVISMNISWTNPSEGRVERVVVLGKTAHGSNTQADQTWLVVTGLDPDTDYHIRSSLDNDNAQCGFRPLLQINTSFSMGYTGATCTAITSSYLQTSTVSSLFHSLIVQPTDTPSIPPSSIWTDVVSISPLAASSTRFQPMPTTVPSVQLPAVPSTASSFDIASPTTGRHSNGTDTDTDTDTDTLIPAAVVPVVIFLIGIVLVVWRSYRHWTGKFSLQVVSRGKTFPQLPYLFSGVKDPDTSKLYGEIWNRSPDLSPESPQEKSEQKQDITACLEEEVVSRKVWLSFPTQVLLTRRTAQALAERLREEGIECLSALQCQTDIAENSYDRIHQLMKSTDVVVCCCNNDFKSSWMRGDCNRPDSDPDPAFYRECIEINCMVNKQQYRGLAIVLMNDASPDCIPDCLQATSYYRFPCDRGFFDLKHRLHNSEPNALETLHTLASKETDV